MWPSQYLLAPQMHHITAKFLSLFAQVKSFYEAEVKNIKRRAGEVPEYPRWFVPCVKKWLQQFQRKAVDFVDNAWEDDKVTFGVSWSK